MDAIVTVKFRIPNICQERDLVDMNMSFEELVRYEIHEEGLMGIVDDADGEVLTVEQDISHD